MENWYISRVEVREVHERRGLEAFFVLSKALFLNSDNESSLLTSKKQWSIVCPYRFCHEESLVACLIFRPLFMISAMSIFQDFT